MNENNLGGRIADLLKKSGLTQRELADKVGVTEVSMSRYISGDRTPKGPVIANIANALHTTSDYLLGTEEKSAHSWCCHSKAPSPGSRSVDRKQHPYPPSSPIQTSWRWSC